jgi:hypothetical protein
MRATTTNNGTDGVVEKERRIFVFYIPVSICNLLILDSRSSLFHNYRIWPWAFRPMGYLWAGQALCKSLHKPKPVDHYFFMGLTSAAIETAKTWQIVGPWSGPIDSASCLHSKHIWLWPRSQRKLSPPRFSFRISSSKTVKTITQPGSTVSKVL